MKVFAVYDSALSAFSTPFFAPTAGYAERMFSNEVNRSDSQMHVHPAYFRLYQLGTFLEDTGEFVNEKFPMVTPGDVLRKEP